MVVVACSTEGISTFQDPEPPATDAGSSGGSGGLPPSDGGPSERPDGSRDFGCGNGRIDPEELCDDANEVDGDGCSADCKTIEAGFLCSQEGAACAPLCGDGVILGTEACDDGNTLDNDGCSSTCQFEPGYHCPTPGEACVPSECGNGVREGLELCDDGNDVPYDGCFECRLEPTCNGNGCIGVCGDGLLFPNEQCDDGNNRSGDGCSADCTLEAGFSCENQTEALPDYLDLPVVFRDFKSPFAHRTTAQDLDEAVSDPEGHPDFERYWLAGTLPAGADGAALDLVKDTLGEDGRPVYNRGADPACNRGSYPQLVGCQQLAGPDEFYEWYHDPATQDTGRSRRVVKNLRLGRLPGTDTYQFDGAAPPYRMFGFFPIDGEGWGTPTDNVCRAGTYGSGSLDGATPIRCVGAQYTLNDQGKCLFARNAWHMGQMHAAGTPIADDPATPQDESTPYPTNYNCIGDDNTPHNFLFTTELHFWFTYQDPGDDVSGPELSFSGDDDVWIFINGKRVIDLGGLHGILTRDYRLTRAEATRLGLTPGGVYDIALFHAERHSTASNFKFTLGGFLKTKTFCEPVCGDGIKTANETCDDGVLAGGYNQCAPGCVWGPRCGDGITQSEFGEQCDDRNFVDNDGCSADCREKTVIN